MSQYPDLFQEVKDPPKNKYANKKPPHYYFKVSGVEPYQGSFGEAEAKHLLGRCLFGYTKAQLDQAVADGLATTISKLLTSHASYTSPINDYYDMLTDPDVAPEASWVNAPFTNDPQINNRRIRSFQAWWLTEMLEQPLSIQEQLSLFWHNHFATQASTVNFSKFTYETNSLLRTNALGNFKTLTSEITFDPGMLLYLNGYKNQKFKPDENYARELQELFTLGKGPDSQYTEDDVYAAARILTGWTFDQNAEVVYNAALHDTDDKQFSAFFDNMLIKGRTDGSIEYQELIDMIFAKDEVAKFIVRKLYRFFVYYVIDEEIEEKVIVPLADTFRNGGYEIAPVLSQLFQSAHFFDPYTKGAIIKNPIDFLLGHFKHINFDHRRNSETERSRGLYITSLLGSLLQMTIGDPPDVAGWDAYHQGPQYHQHWINSVTLPKRNQICDAIMIAPNGLRISGINHYIDILALSEAIPNVNDPNALVGYWTDLLFPKGLSEQQKADLKSILLYGQTEDYYWTVAWEDYIADKQNQQKQQTVYYLLYSFYKNLFNHPEYQLS